jgi:hypothetical protein
MTTSRTADLATMTAAVAIIVQISIQAFEGINPYLVAIGAALVLGTKGLGVTFWKQPVDWILAACLILGGANGLTNMATNINPADLDPGISLSSRAAAPSTFVQGRYVYEVGNPYPIGMVGTEAAIAGYPGSDMGTDEDVDIDIPTRGLDRVVEEDIAAFQESSGFRIRGW